MIDLHLHLLPAVDDGPPDIDASIALARALVEAGVQRAVVTPHIAEWTAAILPDCQAVVERTAALEEALARAGVPLAITAGGECYLVPDLLERVRTGRAPTWGAIPCLLVELSRGQPMLYARQVLSDLVDAGLRVVLAHPERYAFVQARPEALEPLVEMGVLMQVTAQAFRGGGRSPMTRTAEVLLRRGLVHLLASDAHHAGAIPLLLDGLRRARALAGESALATLCEGNPAALLDGGPLSRVLPDPPRWRRLFSGSFGG